MLVSAHFIGVLWAEGRDWGGGSFRIGNGSQGCALYLSKLIQNSGNCYNQLYIEIKVFFYLFEDMFFVLELPRKKWKWKYK